ncbi:MAG: TSUP family transporter [Phycisphaeraceae bacterium]
MTLDQLILVGLLIILGSALQSAVGFGFSIFAIPLIVLVGVDLPAAVAIVLTATLAQVGLSCYRHRADMRWQGFWPMYFMRLATVPAGVWALALLTEAGQGLIKQTLGVVLLAVVVTHWLWRIEPRQRVAPGWGVVAGGASGFFAGLVGMGGPPLVLWVMAHDWPSRQARVFMWFSFLLILPLIVAMLAFRFGEPVLHATLVGVLYMPLTLLGTAFGLTLGARLSRRRLRTATLIVLLMVALAAMIEPVVFGRAG